jgi:hypothetical protein
MIESKITVVELESSKAAARDDLKKPDPDEKAAAKIIERNTVNKGGTVENPKKSD